MGVGRWEGGRSCGSRGASGYLEKGECTCLEKGEILDLRTGKSGSSMIVKFSIILKIRTVSQWTISRT